MKILNVIINMKKIFFVLNEKFRLNLITIYERSLYSTSLYAHSNTNKASKNVTERERKQNSKRKWRMKECEHEERTKDKVWMRMPVTPFEFNNNEKSSAKIN